jgi:Spy/CpxP family protein refolding chaperone
MMGGISKKLAILLVVSLGLNLFMVGLFTSRWFFSERDTRAIAEPVFAGGRGGPFMMRWLLNASDETSREEVDKIWDKRGDSLKNSAGEMRKARRRVKMLLSSKTPDPEALKTAFTALRKHTAVSQAAIHEIMLETALRVTPEQRQAMFGQHRRHRGARGRQGSWKKGCRGNQ